MRQVMNQKRAQVLVRGQGEETVPRL
uniref:Uncharacterized protein n=1 Tax=Anguilla anguilla TaxID=7936 RepID=A0A0E9VJ25_ANGAN